MGIADRVVHALGSRLENRYSSQVRSTFVDRYLNGTKGLDSHLRLILEDAGLTLIEALKTRPDGRGVYLVRNRDGEKSVLKTWYTPRDMDRGLAYRHRAITVSDSESHLFPVVQAAHPTYTVEEFVNGPLLRYCPGDKVWKQQIDRFLDDLRSWSIMACNEVAVISGDYLHEYEIIERCRNVIVRAFRHSQYRARRHIPGYLYGFYRRKVFLQAAIAELAEAAGNAQIPRYVMCGDVHPGNIVVGDEQENRFVIVDYEEMNDGHYGFDVVNLSSQVFRLGLPPIISETLSARLADSEYMGGLHVSGFFLQLDMVLKEILGVVFDVSSDFERRHDDLARSTG